MPKRESPRNITVNANVRALRIYPTAQTKKSVSSLKTVGMKLCRDEAIHLARVLLAATQNWNEIDITAYRLKKRKSDGTYQVTITSITPV